MAIPMPGLDRLPTGPKRDFVAALHDLYDAAGQPAARAIVKNATQLPREFDTVSHETVSATLRASSLPTWDKVRSIVRVLADRTPDDFDTTGCEQRMSVLWRQARRADQDDQTEPGDIIAAGTLQRPSRVRARPVPQLPDSPPAPGTRPEAVARFVGRESLIAAIHEAFSDATDVRLVLHGPAGSGKTQAVLHYLDRHPGSTPVWWVPAGTVESIMRSLVALAAVSGIDIRARLQQTVRQVLDLVESGRIPHLLVFDDLQGPDLLALVPNSGHVIITTRDPAIGHDGSSRDLRVGDLDDDEATLILREHEPGVTADTVATIVGVHGYTPLGLTQVVAWSRQTGVPLAGPVPADPTDCLTSTPVEGYPSSAFMALLFSMERLETASRQALFLLNVLACFAARPISKELLRGSPSPAPGDPVAMNVAITELCRHGLARLTDDGDLVEVLPQARLVARRAMSREDRAEAHTHAQTLLAAANPGWPDDQPSTHLYREIAHHAQAVGLTESDSIAARRAVYHLIRFLYLAGDNTTACELGEQADLRWREGDNPSRDNYLLLRTTHEWANALRALGRYDQAGRLTLRAISQLRVDPDYGEDHRYTLAMASSRAADLRIAGKYQRALEIDRETFQRCLLLYGENHQRTTMNRHNLAISLRLKGDFRDAETVDRDALRRHRTTFGDGDWRTLLSVNALAEDLNGQGRYRDVLDELGRVVTAIEQHHREQGRQRTRMERGLLLAKRALALAHRGAGRYAEARGQLASAYAECAELFGERNEHTLALRMSYANTLHLLGLSGDALAAAELVLADYRRMFGVDNPLTSAAEINLANILRALGETGAALNIDRLSSEALRETVGLEHPFAVAAAINLASDYAQNGHPHRIEASRRAVELARRVHRSDHPDVIAAETNQTLDLAAAGHPSAAFRRHQALGRLEEVHGSGHPITAMANRGERVDCIVEPPLP